MLEKAGLKSESDISMYEEALTYSSSGFTIILERDISEMYINSYNPEWARAWNGNTDLQVCLDYFAVITYITEYYTKDDTGVMRKIIDILKKSDCASLQEKMKLVMKSFITARQMGECEAYYKILPDFKLNDSNVTVVFVPTNRKEMRSKFMIKVEENEDYNGREKKQIQGREGWFVEKYDLIDKYVRLDSTCEARTELVTAQFLKMYEATHKKKEAQQDTNRDELDDIDDEGFNIQGSDEKFNFVMKASPGKPIPLPEYIEIENQGL